MNKWPLLQVVYKPVEKIKEVVKPCPTALPREGDTQYDRPFDLNKLTPTRNDLVYKRLKWITESAYFNDLLARDPPNDDPEVIEFIR